MSRKDRRIIAWVFTINNPTPADYEMMRYFATPLALTSHFVVGLEGRGKTTHLQGVVSFVYGKSFSEMKKLIPRAHLEPLRFDYSKAAAYCRKEGNVLYDYGDQKLTRWLLYGENDEVVAPKPENPSLESRDSNGRELMESFVRRVIDYGLSSRGSVGEGAKGEGEETLKEDGVSITPSLCSSPSPQPTLDFVSDDIQLDDTDIEEHSEKYHPKYFD